MISSIVDKVQEYAVLYADKAAIIEKDTRFTYLELFERIQQKASYFRKKGIVEGDRVIITAISKPDYIICYLATHFLGAIAVPIDKNSSNHMVLELQKEVDAKLILFDSEREIEQSSISEPIIDTNETRVQLFDKIPITLRKEDQIADILYTTGTTGQSKGVMLSHKNIVTGAKNIIEGVEMKENDIDLIPVPLHHAYGLGTIRALLYRGATIVLQDGFASTKQLYHNLNQYKCTGISCVPAAINLLYRQTKGQLDLLLGTLRYIELGSASLDLQMKRTIMELLPNTSIYVNYGATESPRTVYMDLQKHPEKLHSIGKAVSYATAAVFDDHHLQIESSKEKIGRLGFSGSMNMLGYWNSEQLSKEVLFDGWYYTNDLVYMDREGFIYMVGRANDVIHIGGEKVSPYEIESTILEEESIEACACIGAEDKEHILGEIPIAFLVIKEGYLWEESSLKEKLQLKLESFKLPVYYIVLEKIPVNFMSKVDKRELKRLWEEKYKEKIT